MRIPGLRRIARREGEAIFDLVAGFCHSQVLMALVDLGLLQRLGEGPAEAAQLSRVSGVPAERLEVLLRSAISLGLFHRRGGTLHLTARGAALAAVPGLTEMISHHRLLYRDLEDPAAFFRGETEPELAGFWPYVFGAGAAEDPAQAAAYSRLMTESQALVAEDTLALCDFGSARRLMDVGGGAGAFLSEVATRYPDLPLTLFDLPAVAPAAESRLGTRVRICSGSFRNDSLPSGADVVTLIRVLYDHSDETVRALLGRVHAALPDGGRLVVSEPMAGSRAGDAYFSLYCMAMRTGRVRSPSEIRSLMAEAGFAPVRPRSRRPFVTTVVEGVRNS
ncbi:acetylserotonin O-methyltransferase [Histidinibacterium aquaticum]|nr:acetylserotonin O-methyltransferase [Histidinibacterium aquaticum]